MGSPERIQAAFALRVQQSSPRLFRHCCNHEDATLLNDQRRRRLHPDIG